MSAFLLANGAYLVGFVVGGVAYSHLAWPYKASAIAFAMAAIPALIEGTGGFR